MGICINPYISPVYKCWFFFALFSLLIFFVLFFFLYIFLIGFFPLDDNNGVRDGDCFSSVSVPTQNFFIAFYYKLYLLTLFSISWAAGCWLLWAVIVWITAERKIKSKSNRQNHGSQQNTRTIFLSPRSLVCSPAWPSLGHNQPSIIGGCGGPLGNMTECLGIGGFLIDLSGGLAAPFHIKLRL